MALIHTHEQFIFVITWKHRSMAKSCNSNIEPFWVRSSKPHKRRCFSYQNFLELTWRASNMSVMLQFRHDILMVSGNRKKPAPTYFNWRFQIWFYVRTAWNWVGQQGVHITYLHGWPWLSVLISWWQTWCGALLILLQKFKNYSCYECEPWMNDDIGTRYLENKHSVNFSQISSMLYPVHKEKIAVVCQWQKTRYIHAKSFKTRKRFNWTIWYRSVPTS